MILLAFLTASSNRGHLQYLIGPLLGPLVRYTYLSRTKFSIQEKRKRKTIVLPRDLLQDYAYANTWTPSLVKTNQLSCV